MAAEGGHVDIVKYLIGKKADISIEDIWGVSITSHKMFMNKN